MADNMELCQALLFGMQLPAHNAIDSNESLHILNDSLMVLTNSHSATRGNYEFLPIAQTTTSLEQYDVITAAMPSESETLIKPSSFAWFEAILMVLCATGIVGNTLNLLVLTKRRFRTSLGHLEGSANYGLVSLAMSDLAFCVVVLPHAFLPGMSGYYDGYMSGRWLLIYKLYGVSCINLLQMTSTWIIVVISVNRWIVVRFPLEAKAWIDRRGTIACIVSVCVMSFILTLPYFMHMKIGQCRDGSGDVMYELTQPWQAKTQSYFRFYLKWIWPVFANFVPLLLLSFFNIQLVQHVKMALRPKPRLEVGRRVNSREGNSNKVTVTLLSIVLMYLALVTPAEVMRYYNPYAAWGDTGVIVAKILNLFITCNFAVNFLLYCVVNATFRQTAKEMLRCLKQQGHVTTSAVKQLRQGQYSRVNSNLRSSSKTSASVL